jgi:subtilisin family serine protease
MASVALAIAHPLPQSEHVYIVTLRNAHAHPGEVGRSQLARYGGHIGFVYRYGPIGYSATLTPQEARELARDLRVESVVADSPAEATAQTASTGIKRIFAFGNKALQFDETVNRTINADVAVIDAGFKGEGERNIIKSVVCKTSGGSTTCKEEVGTDRSDGHGTAVASVVGAIDNKEGVVGVAPGVRLWSIKVLESTGTTESKVVAAINWVTEHAAEIEVANMSIGCGECTAAAIKTAISAAVGAGVVFVVAAGNENLNVNKNGYAANPNAIIVSGVADYDGKPEFEAASLWTPNCGAKKLNEGEEKVGEDDERYSRSDWGELVDIAAPAVCIRTLAPGGGLFYWTGTSFAAPEVAGAAAILAEHENPETLSDVNEISETLKGNGNFGWVDTSADGFWEPMLDLSNEKVFK